MTAGRVNPKQRLEDQGITGLGSVSLDVDADGVDTDNDRVKDQEKEIEKETSTPGVWTLIFGILLIASAVVFFFPKIAQWGVVASVLIGFALMVMASVFFADPVSAVADSDVEGNTDDWGAGYGLWIVFFAALIAFFVAVAALVMLLLPQKPKPTAYGGWPQQGGYQPGGYAAGGYQNGGMPQTGYPTGGQGYGGYGNQPGGYNQYPGQNQWPSQ